MNDFGVAPVGHFGWFKDGGRAAFGEVGKKATQLVGIFRLR